MTSLIFKGLCGYYGLILDGWVVKMTVSPETWNVLFMICRSWVRTLVRSNLGCTVLYVALEPKTNSLSTPKHGPGHRFPLTLDKDWLNGLLQDGGKLQGFYLVSTILIKLAKYMFNISTIPPKTSLFYLIYQVNITGSSVIHFDTFSKIYLEDN